MINTISNESNLSGLDKKDFQKNINNKKTDLFILKNTNGMEVAVTNYGCAILSIMSPMLYSVLALAGKYSLDELKEFRQWGSPTPGHPERDLSRGIENTSGPLGQGHTFAVGAAIAAKFMPYFPNLPIPKRALQQRSFQKLQNRMPKM